MEDIQRLRFPDKELVSPVKFVSNYCRFLPYLEIGLLWTTIRASCTTRSLLLTRLSYCNLQAARNHRTSINCPLVLSVFKRRMVQSNTDTYKMPPLWLRTPFTSHSNYPRSPSSKRSAKLMIIDFMNAFFILSVHSDIHHLLGFTLPSGHWCNYQRLSMGHGVSSAYFDRFSSAVRFLWKDHRHYLEAASLMHEEKVYIRELLPLETPEQFVIMFYLDDRIASGGEGILLLLTMYSSQGYWFSRSISLNMPRRNANPPPHVRYGHIVAYSKTHSILWPLLQCYWIYIISRNSSWLPKLGLVYSSTG